MMLSVLMTGESITINLTMKQHILTLLRKQLVRPCSQEVWHLLHVSLTSKVPQLFHLQSQTRRSLWWAQG